jgi:hypothetical protein
MPTHTATSTDELQRLLLTAEPGDTIQLAPGEYRGPFLIEKPLHLQGENRRTVLWRRGGPVVYVRVPEVRLERLYLERTVAPGPLVIHDTECIPTGKESMEVGETLINLGELTPGATITLPIEIETRGRAEIVVAGMYGAQIAPSRVDKKGKHSVMLTIEGQSILKGEVLLGEMALKEEGGTRYVWISGVVLDAPLPEQTYALATKKAKLHPSASGLALDGHILAALEGSSASGRFAFIQREASGNLYLYVPGEPPSPVHINDRAIPRLTRQLLREGDTIKISKSIFTVQPVEPPAITLEPARVAFPTFGEQFPEPIPLTIRPNAGWVGQLVSTAHWLTVTPPGTIRLSGTKPHKWQIALTEDVLTMPNGKYDAVGGLMLIGSEHILSLDVFLEIKRPDVSLTIQPLDAGSVEAEWPSEHEAEFQISNFGRGAWNGTIRSTVDWLEVLTPMPIGGATWSAALVQVKVTSPEGVPPGRVELPDALVLTLEDGDMLPIPATLEVGPAKGHLAILTDQISFQDVERGVPTLPTARLQVRNAGGAPLTASAQVVQGWVQVTPAEFTLDAGQALDLSVDLLNIPDQQALNVPQVIDQVQITTAAGGEAVPVMLTVVELPPYVVAPLVSFPPFVRGDMPPDAPLSIHNMGPAVWRGIVRSSLDWLSVPERLLICQPGENVDLYVTLLANAMEVLEPGFSRHEAALTISGARTAVTVAVQVDLREVSSELVLETPTLNFGLVNGGAVDLPTDTLRLLNASPQEWKGTIEVNVPWLTLEGETRSLEVDIPKMSVAEFKVALDEKARQLPPGTIFDESALLITGGEAKSRQRLNVRALLSMLEWGPVLEVRPPRLKINGETPQTLTIRNVGKRSWRVLISAAPWLSASPNEVLIEPNKESQVEISKRREAADEQIDDPRAVVIVGQGREVEVRVSR